MIYLKFMHVDNTSFYDTECLEVNSVDEFRTVNKL